MKKALPILFVVLSICSFGLNAQTDLSLNLQHFMGDQDFAMSTMTTNNLDNEFTFTRCTYYISGISLVHDGGQETALDDVYVLVKPGEEVTSVDLGNYDVTELNAIRFHIGVDESMNHEDPALQGNGSPLAPQNPSMHWGWVSGYRFIALEGQSGNNLSQFWELHGLEDDFYFQTEVEIPMGNMASNGKLDIYLDADYARAMENINVSNGLVVHGGFGDAVKALENFRDYVFTATPLVSNSIDLSEITRFAVYPNPAQAGQVQFALETLNTDNYQVSITDQNGRLVQYFQSVAGNSVLDMKLTVAGTYFVNLQQNGQVLLSQQLVIQ